MGVPYRVRGSKLLRPVNNRKTKEKKLCACCGSAPVPPHNRMLCDRCYKAVMSEPDAHDWSCARTN